MFSAWRDDPGVSGVEEDGAVPSEICNLVHLESLDSNFIEDPWHNGLDPNIL